MQPLSWTNIEDIAIALEKIYPHKNIMKISFPNLRDMIYELDEFSDSYNGCNEKILEAIQSAWLEERSLNKEE